MGKLFLAFIALALTELYLLIALGRAVGFWSTVGILLAVSAVGTVVSRTQGARVMARWQEALNAGTMPAEGVLDGVLVLVGGALLIAPGFITDVLGISLLVPVSRAFWAAAKSITVRARAPSQPRRRSTSRPAGEALSPRRSLANRASCARSRR